MKQTVQITLASIVAITLLTTGIVYANDDLMTEIEKAIEKLTKADKQQDKQIKNLNKQIKNLTSQIDELQQQHENQQDKIKRLKDFRDNALADMQTMHSDLDTVMNPIPRPTPENAIITLNKTTVARGDYLEFVVNYESLIPTNNTLRHDMYFQVRDHINLPDIILNWERRIDHGQEYAQLGHWFEFVDGHYQYTIRAINQTAITFMVHVPVNHQLGLHNMIVDIDVEYITSDDQYRQNSHDYKSYHYLEYIVTHLES